MALADVMLLTLAIVLVELTAPQAAADLGGGPPAAAISSPSGEVCDFGWGPEINVFAGDLQGAERYQIPEKFRQQRSNSTDRSSSRSSEFSSARRRGADCPTQILPLTRFPDALVAPFRFSGSGFAREQRLDLHSGQQWKLQWRRMANNSSTKYVTPAIDFHREMVLIAAMGARPSGGYRVVIDRVIDRPRDIQVIVKHLSPGPNCGAIAAVTYPVDVVRIPSSDKPVNWVVLEQLTNCP